MHIELIKSNGIIPLTEMNGISENKTKKQIAVMCLHDIRKENVGVFESNEKCFVRTKQE